MNVTLVNSMSIELVVKEAVTVDGKAQKTTVNHPQPCYDSLSRNPHYDADEAVHTQGRRYLCRPQ